MINLAFKACPGIKILGRGCSQVTFERGEAIKSPKGPLLEDETGQTLYKYQPLCQSGTFICLSGYIQVLKGLCEQSDQLKTAVKGLTLVMDRRLILATRSAILFG
jgi:hypothetical protein